MLCFKRRLVVWFGGLTLLVIAIITLNMILSGMLKSPVIRQVKESKDLIGQVKESKDLIGQVKEHKDLIGQNKEHKDLIGQDKENKDKPRIQEDSHLHKREGLAIRRLDYGPRQVRVLCWIMTDPDDLDKRTVHVRDTWARDCDLSLFMSSKENSTFPTVGLNVTKGRGHIASKSRAAWTYVYMNHFNDAEYFVKADPDTYMLVDNLRGYLAHCDPNKSEMFGHRFNKRAIGAQYVSGGPGVVLSREALRRLVTMALVLHPGCFKDGQSEDAKTGLCLSKVGVRLHDTRDSQGRETFMVFNANTHLNGAYPAWYYTYDLNGPVKGRGCCSMAPISFHYVAKEMHLLHYLLNVVQRSERQQNYTLVFNGDTPKPTKSPYAASPKGGSDKTVFHGDTPSPPKVSKQGGGDKNVTINASEGKTNTTRVKMENVSGINVKPDKTKQVKVS